MAISTYNASALDDVALLEQPAQAALDILALPHWFTPSIVETLLPDHSGEQLLDVVDELTRDGAVEFGPGADRKHVTEHYRLPLLERWYAPERREEFERLSGSLAKVCAREAGAARTATEQVRWGIERLYHLAVTDPEEALARARTRCEEAISGDLDLNQAELWLRPLEERRTYLRQRGWDAAAEQTWTAELRRLRDALAARTYWADDWYRTIHYLPRQRLIDQFAPFYAGSGPEAPWLLNLYAPGGFGKSATIRWLLARDAPTRDLVCARFDYDALSPAEQRDAIEDPRRVLDWLGRSLSAQRFGGLAAFDRQAELQSDPTGTFTYNLIETFPEQMVVIFIDTLEVLLESRS